VAETKKLQEKTAAFSAELAEFLNSEYPYKKPALAKYIIDSQLKTNENVDNTEKIDNTNHVDSSYFDAPLQQSLNSENKVKTNLNKILKEKIFFYFRLAFFTNNMMLVQLLCNVLDFRMSWTLAAFV